ncbi:hypothetical protein FKP32DRAFT_16034 [Trametes sanguinea]|nr:hypothetical protein FKP32DRAFT_16034 [Trametes sanguinea]
MRNQLTCLCTHSFFHNTGAVAGVFTVVGLAALAIVIALVTNAMRRRRAKKLDREIAEAAAEAAHAPAFVDDDYYPDDRLGKGGSSTGGGPSSGGDLRSAYSDTTHGTFAQAAPGNAEPVRQRCKWLRRPAVRCCPARK